ncbi:MAG: glycine cleavage system protein GcvH [Bacteroidales bacterium]|jgi:glycine cleavage system H protein|nr:glycine cleavage system protein GcvH [Bacteroidales bacterium]NLP20927.1 glycine cleavage system protein GcvH [Bacteroidales bacterium]OQC44805.1 MAG: Glycine cleavage system H protein [Bacteroidetes bacterium ADurb.Bin028]HNY44263.1 glycine cleavage system protein GcvH [Bacteroidales bacterium]HOD87829.1 glycine cleavage system protein GcvH [Bacteroidales bacterium]
MNIPKNLKYAESHEWVRVEGDVAVVGITDFAQTSLGDIVFLDIEVEGETLDKGEVYGSIEAVKTVSDSYMPVSGEVIEVNQEAIDDPSIVNKDPYGEGWLLKIKMSDPSEVNSLLDAAGYEEIAKD